MRPANAFTGGSPNPLLRRLNNMKNKKLSIRISEDDLRQIHDRAVKAKLSVTDYVTKCCLGKQIVVIDGLDEIIRQQKAVGNNLNQIAVLCNMGRIKAVDLAKLTEEYSKINEQLTELLRRRRWKT